MVFHFFSFFFSSHPSYSSYSFHAYLCSTPPIEMKFLIFQNEAPTFREREFNQRGQKKKTLMILIYKQNKFTTRPFFFEKFDWIFLFFDSRIRIFFLSKYRFHFPSCPSINEIEGWTNELRVLNMKYKRALIHVLVQLTI